MAEIIGRDIEAGVSVEETRGTVAPSMERAIKKVTAEVLPNAEHVTDDSTQGVLADSENRRVVQKWIEGDIEGPARVGMLGYFLYNLYGAVSSSELDTSGVYEHVFTLQDDIKHPSLTVFLKDGSIAQYAYNGGMVTSFELNAAPDDLVRFTASMAALDSQDDTSTFSYTEDYDFIGKDVTVEKANTSSGLGGATPMDVKDLTITWDPNAITDEFVFGSYTPKDIYNAGMSIEVSLTKQYLDSTFEELYRSDDSKYLRITIEGDADIGGGNAPKVQITLNKAKVTDWSRSGDADEVATEDVTLKGFYNESDSAQSEVITQSTVTEYDVASTS